MYRYLFWKLLILCSSNSSRGNNIFVSFLIWMIIS